MAHAALMGVYRLYDTAAQLSFIGFSRNLEGTRKRLTFELKLNACSYKQLQTHYNACAGEMRFEILEEYHPDDALSEQEVDAHLHAMTLKYMTRLNARRLQVEV